MSLVIIFLLIGIAHWAAHILQCPTCLRTIGSLAEFLLDGTIKTFGWPFQLVGYIRAARAPEAVGSPKGMRTPPNAAFFEIKQREGETREAFVERIKTTVGEITQKATKDKPPSETL